MDAIEFLEEWPVERRGLLHGAACDTCYSAYDGRKSARGRAQGVCDLGTQGGCDRRRSLGAVLDDRAEDWQCTRTNR
ncbi:DUF982 domain-containing protein [Mesorhizobium sp. XAP10]|uniref:DUF982 domain-containing protein n=1 Tax=unclassified Mesorhizobium TaxID=325217 RepID=UPI0023E0175D|nr:MULTISPECIES: DUF982 domain-containing protein [unclassified Mesorhizobium]MDF3156606.1 DUF982 domain-containing protein [Mesorhizobium sp. XAP10]MDF3249491.1 DUF982 domain-containing protein [Mesorhizobium sp. XAP4]